MILQSKHFDFSRLRNFLYLLTLSLRPPNLFLIIGLQFLLYGQLHFIEEGNFLPLNQQEVMSRQRLLEQTPS